MYSACSEASAHLKTKAPGKLKTPPEVLKLEKPNVAGRSNFRRGLSPAWPKAPFRTQVHIPGGSHRGRQPARACKRTEVWAQNHVLCILSRTLCTYSPVIGTQAQL